MSITSVVHLQGYEWRANLANPIPLWLRWLLYIPTDSLSHLQDSNIKVFDSTGELGPAHSLHADIIKKGAGRFSYWLGILRFSTRDNLPPNHAVNAGNIKIIAVPVLYPFYEWAALIAGLYLLSLFVLRFMHTRPGSVLITAIRFCHQRRSIGWPIVFIFVCVDYIHLLATVPRGILTFSDSGSYLLFSPVVTIGYPLFIHAVIYALGSPYYIVLIQFACSACAITYFCKAIEGQFSAVTVIAIGVLMAIKGDTADLSYSLLTDSFGYSIILLMSALWIRFAYRPRWGSVIGMVILLNIAVAIRPAMFSLIVPTIALTLCYFRHSRKYLLLALAGCVLAFFSNTALHSMTSQWLKRSNVDHYLNTIWPIEYGTYHTKFWQSTSRGTASIVGDILLGQVRLAITPGQRSRYPTETNEIAAVLAPQREAFDNAKSWEEKYAIFAQNHGSLIDGVLIKLHPEIIDTPNGYHLLGNLYTTLAMETIKDHPLALPEITWIKLMYEITTTLVGSWQAEYNIQSTASIGSRVWNERYGLSSGPYNMTPPGGMQHYLDIWVHPLLPIMFLMAIGYCIVFMLFLFSLIRYNHKLFILSLFGVFCFTYTMMVCFMARPLYRYGMPIAPAYVFLLIGSIELCFRHAYSVIQRFLRHQIPNLLNRDF